MMCCCINLTTGLLEFLPTWRLHATWLKTLYFMLARVHLQRTGLLLEVPMFSKYLHAAALLFPRQVPVVTSSLILSS